MRPRKPVVDEKPAPGLYVMRKPNGRITRRSSWILESTCFRFMPDDTEGQRSQTREAAERCREWVKKQYRDDDVFVVEIGA